MKNLFFLIAMIISFGSYALPPITGTMGCCVGGSSTLSDTSSGGIWSSSNITIATVGTSGVVTGVSAGIATITYTVGSAYSTATFTVSGTLPASITGVTTFCMGTSSTLSDATPGGAWSSGNPAVASISSTSGIATGVSAGSAVIHYTLGTGCQANTTVTITSAAPALDSILGPSSVCIGSTITLTEAVTGGTWSSSAPAIATVSTGGVVTGLLAGFATISYTVTTSCGSSVTTKFISVVSTASAGSISGAGTVPVGSTIPLSESVSGGTWASSNSSVATVGSGTGIVTGIAAGTATITYTVTGCGGSAYTTASVTVSVVNRISGNVNFSGSGLLDPLGTLKVWLIAYNPTTMLLEAVDSIVTVPGIVTSYYYQFLSKPTDSYRVKAAYFPTTFSSTGYVPTYHINSFYWHDANAFYHTAGSADDYKHINMAYGTVTSGLGFVAGDITTGANKGTTGDAPAINMLVYILNSTGTELQQAYTDAAGHYTFSNLPFDTYTVYPELINYTTIAYTGITLTATSPSMTAASFGQHTTPLTIRPKTTGIQNINTSVFSVIAFPNPTHGKLNIQWNEAAAGKANLTVTDAIGREVYTNTLTLTREAGYSQVDISCLQNGVYLLSINSASISYTGKLVVQH